MSRIPIGIVLNGVTGRMGYRQHLVRSLLAIREQGGLATASGYRIWPEPVLVGRSEAKLAELAARHGLTEWTTDLAAALLTSAFASGFAATGPSNFAVTANAASTTATAGVALKPNAANASAYFARSSFTATRPFAAARTSGSKKTSFCSAFASADAESSADHK